jgi:hypothetical protein
VARELQFGGVDPHCAGLEQPTRFNGSAFLSKPCCHAHRRPGFQFEIRSASSGSCCRHELSEVRFAAHRPRRSLRQLRLLIARVTRLARIGLEPPAAKVAAATATLDRTRYAARAHCRGASGRITRAKRRLIPRGEAAPGRQCVGQELDPWCPREGTQCATCPRACARCGRPTAGRGRRCLPCPCAA